MIRCSKCAQDNPEAAVYCQRCGAPLANFRDSPEVIIAQPVPEAGDETVATIIPYRNAGALIAYYLGLFSCFPVLGFPLAIVALVCGFKGLKAVRANPNAHGTAHAWIGLICGTIGFLINLLILSAIAFAILTEGGR